MRKWIGIIAGLVFLASAGLLVLIAKLQEPSTEYPTEQVLSCGFVAYIMERREFVLTNLSGVRAVTTVSQAITSTFPEAHIDVALGSPSNVLTVWVEPKNAPKLEELMREAAARANK